MQLNCTNKKTNNIQKGRPIMTTKRALELALTALNYAKNDIAKYPDIQEIEEAMETIRHLLAIQGCEHFDHDVKDGKLTTLIDVVINRVKGAGQGLAT